METNAGAETWDDVAALTDPGCSVHRSPCHHDRVWPSVPT